MRKKILTLLLLLPTLLFGQINTDRVMLVGRFALEYEDYVLAIQYFNKVINAKPYLHLPYFYRSLAKLNLEDYMGAEDDCNEVIRRNPYFVGAYQVRGLTRIHLDNYDGAIEDYKKILSYAPEDIGALNNLSLSFVNKERYDEAEQVLDRLNSVAPKYTMAYLIQGDVAMRKKDTITAVNRINTALEIDKFDANIWSARGMLNLMTKKYPEAEKDLSEAIYLSGKDPEHFINRALARYHQTNLRGAMSDYDLALNVDPNNFFGHYNRGLLRAQVGDYNRSLEDFDFVLEIDPDNMMATFNRGMLRNRTGDLNGAEADFSKVLSVFPGFYPGYQLRYDVRKRKGDIVGAEEDELTLIKMQLDKSNNQSTKDKNKVEETRKRSDKNMQNYRRLVVADKNDIGQSYTSEYRGKVQNKKIVVKSEPYFTLSYLEKDSEIRRTINNHKFIDDLNNLKVLPDQLLITNRDKALTLNEVNKYFALIDVHTLNISSNPNDVNYWFARGLDFLLVQDVENSIKDFTEAVRLDPQFFPAYFMRSLARLRQIEYDKSVDVVQGNVNIPSRRRAATLEYEYVFRDLDEVISIAPNFVFAYFNKARLSFELKDYTAAIDNYSKAISNDPSFAEAYFNRGLIYVFLGDNDNGVSDLSKAGELGVVEAYNIIKRFREKSK